MKNYALALVLLLLTAVIMAGCGETLNGLSKDARRIKKGVKTVFMRTE